MLTELRDNVTPEMIEAMARALCREHGIDPDEPLQLVWAAPGYEGSRILAWTEWVPYAQVAARAMLSTLIPEGEV